MVCGQGVFVVGQQFFIQLLAGAQASEFDGDFVFTEPGQLDHALGQVCNFYGFTHVQYENLAATAHAGRLKYQLRGFWNRHEVTGDVRVGDGNRPAFGDLFLKLGDDAAGAAQHIAETHHLKAGGAVALLLQQFTNHFGHTLGSPHDVGGVNGLVG